MPRPIKLTVFETAQGVGTLALLAVFLLCFGWLFAVVWLAFSIAKWIERASDRAIDSIVKGM